MKGGEFKMKKFIVMYTMSQSAADKEKETTPEDMKKGMEPWMEWAKRCGEGLVDLGTPLGNGQKVTKSGSTPSDSGVAGYSILQAENMEGAKALLEGHPHLDWAEGCEIEVYECLPVPGM